jgi:hypothetical protein
MTFRDYTIEAIINSRFWQDCVTNGLEDELPNLANMSNEELLALVEHICTRR